ncbi:hypothetical protein BVJ53_05660 [Lacticaseibacillus chiayiensis]|uniref:SMEK domain-containing protein n=1 Tax=Lacticaseibacillus chiayiensis TaxID=2100821 RepID=A0A4Q1U5K9_9LACO|nr:ABC-three component system protein [Lacticaseibacillus chiayiensis]RXT26839.1 hypothetical protein BVJ53_05660 [Lacticaseibacillus chiayiensis]UYN55754.1 SMEK domain-containing protein [Lacticaseibacillus chiayiensis]
MAPREVYLKAIGNALAYLVSQLSVNGRMNLLDGHMLSEHFFEQFLNELYGWHLATANDTVANASSIDLIDSASKLSVQITTNKTKSKVQNTLEKASKAHDGFRVAFVFIALDARNLAKMKYSIPKNISFNPKTDIFDIGQLLLTCQDKQTETLLRLQDLCKSEVLPVMEDIPVQESELVKVLRAVAKINIEITNTLKVPMAFDIQQKIDFNDLGLIQQQTIDELAFYNASLDDIYELFTQEGITPGIIFQKLSSIYQRQSLENPDDSAPLKFLNMVDALMTYVHSTSRLDNEMSQEKVEYCCRIILVDAFIRCKIFKNPEGYSYDSTNRHPA